MTTFNQPFTTQQDLTNKLSAINYKNGKIVKITYQNVSDNGIVAIKVGYYRLGIAYNHIQKNIDKWAMEMALGIEKKTRQSSDTTINEYLTINKNGELKLKVYPIYNKNLKSKISYFYNGVETTKQWLLDNGLLKEKTYNSEPPTMFTIFLKNLLAIG